MNFQYKTKEIADFVKSLKDLDDKPKTIHYDYSKYNCEIAEFVEAQVEFDVEKCLEFYRKQENNQFFEIKHPIYNDIKTRAIYSSIKEAQAIQYEFLFFIDQNNQYPWILLSSIDSPTYAITSDGIFHITHIETLGVFRLNFIKNWICEILENIELFFKDITWGYNLQDPFPLHYFYENLCYFYLLKTNKNIADTPSFFIPKKYVNKKTNNEVYIIPKCFGNQYIQVPSWYVVNMGKEVYQESMQDFDEIVQKDNEKYDLKIWLSLTATDWGSKRWIEQIEGSVNIINQLLKYFQKIKIYFDGITALENSENDTPFDFNSKKSTEVEIKLLKAIETYSNTKRLDIQSLNSLTFRQKICYCSTVDICIAEPGSAGITPSLCCQKPCILFGNYAYLYCSRLCHVVKYSKIIDPYFIKLSPKKEVASWEGLHPYHIPWQYIYNLCAEVLEELSRDGKLSIDNLKMHRLKIPKVDIIAKKYDLSLKQKEIDERLQQNKEKSNDKFLNFLAEEFIKKDDSIKGLENEKEHLNKQIGFLQGEIINLNSIPQQIAREDLKIKKLQVKELEKKLGLKLSKLEPRVNLVLNKNLKTSAVVRVRNHLAYRLGAAIIVCNKSLFGLLSLPFVLSFIKANYKKEQNAYKVLIKQRPDLKLPNLETYADYQAALKEKECLTYKLGEAMMRADKAWYKGVYVKFYFEAKRLEREFNL